MKKHLNWTLKKNKSDFIKMLETKVKPNRLFFFDIFDSEQKEFYGIVNENDFWLRKSDRLIPNCPWASATGIMKTESNKTTIELKIKGWNWFIILWICFMTIIFGLALSDVIKTNQFGILVVFAPIFLMFYLFALFKMRQGVKRFEKYLKAELNE
ncbi:hypothetical protein [Winogradskyella sp.]|uniref:hypothetical protein n=1 Tax=Winogradskyella sp. TaxID=1883156 RepID=UPI00260660A5|nr:hypothetical protein [Winogradskyella sp.]